MTAYTFVVTARPSASSGLAPFGPSHVGAEITQALEANRWEIIPCDWAPDADTIADAVDDDEVRIIDLNPSRTVPAGFVLGMYDEHEHGCAFAERGEDCTCGDTGMPDVAEIRERRSELVNRLAAATNRSAIVSLSAAVDALDWVLGIRGDDAE